ncbi:MAG: hypothetical protein ABIT09_06620 [Croceibacterium sp.]
MDAEKLLADLAAIWVERWLKYGGGLIVDVNCDKIQISKGELNWRHSRLNKAPEYRRQAQWHDGWHVGRWRELADLCSLIPGLRAAIIEHVAQNGRDHGEHGYHLWRPAPA